MHLFAHMMRGKWNGQKTQGRKEEGMESRRVRDHARGREGEREREREREREGERERVCVREREGEREREGGRERERRGGVKVGGRKRGTE